MPTPPLQHELLLQAVNAVAEHGSQVAAADALGIPRNTFKHRILRAQATGVIPTWRPPFKAIQSKGSVVMHIPDLHAPFMHADVATFIRAAKEKYSPDIVVLAGDETDQHAMSDYTPDPDGYSPGHELRAAIEQLQEVYAVIKEAKVCDSNHGQRPFKRAYKSGIPSAYLKSYAQFMGAPTGWEWGSEFIIDGVRYTHGEEATGANGALNLAIRLGMSQAVGHWHGNAGASYFYNGTRMVFGLYSGCLIDANAYAFRYGKHAKLKPVLGLSIIDHGVPSFIPMQLDKHNRWSGKI